MRRPKPAFTLLELISVLGILAVLMGILIVAMKGVRQSASRTESLGALRQIISAYNQYSHDNQGWLLPGYIGADLMANGEPFEHLTVKLASGKPLKPEDASSYVWRLAPYVGDAWTTFYADTGEPRAVAAMDADFGQDRYGPYSSSNTYEGGISERPTYGLNSIFVGGDSVHGGSIAQMNPWEGGPKVAATRLTHAKQPQRLIVFAPTAKLAEPGADTLYDDPEVGYCELRPPYLDLDNGVWTSCQWSMGLKSVQVDMDCADVPPGVGLPIVRAGTDQIPVANLDASTEIVAVGEIGRDMRRWKADELLLRETVAPTPR